MGPLGAPGQPGAPGATGTGGGKGDIGPWGPPGPTGDAPAAMAEWETSLDSYDGIIAGLETHSEKLRNLLETKQDNSESKMQELRIRLAKIANGSVDLQLMSKGMIAQMSGLARKGHELAYNATHLRKLFTGEIRDAEKLAAVEGDMVANAMKCEDCEDKDKS